MIRLARTVKLRAFDAQGTVAVGRRRPELLAVARLAADVGRPLRPRDVADELLGGGDELLARRVIERCVRLGLLEAAGCTEAQLTEAGRLALDSEDVLVEEEDIWRFFVVEDLVVGDPLVHVQHLLPASREEQHRERGRHAEAGLGVVPTPAVLTRRRGVARSVVHGHFFQVVDVARQGWWGPQAELELTIEWAEKPSVRLRGALPLDGKDPVEIDALIPASRELTAVDREELLDMCLAACAACSPSDVARWRQITGRLALPMRFASLDEAARRRFVTRPGSTKIELPGLGTFTAVVDEELEVVPADADDAASWLAWLQWDSVESYLTRTGVEQKGEELARRFVHHRVRPVSAEALLERAKREPDPRAPFLLAPFDLGLWES